MDAREIDKEVENTEREGESVDKCDMAVFPRTKANITRELVVGFLGEISYLNQKEYNQFSGAGKGNHDDSCKIELEVSDFHPLIELHFAHCNDHHLT